MKRTEKLTIGAIVIAACVSAALYGVWEDKVWLFAPLLTLIYIALAVWAMSSGFRVQSSELKSGVRGRLARRSLGEVGRTEDGRQRTDDRDQRSEVRGRKLEGRDQRLTVRDQNSEIAGPTSDLRPLTSGSRPPTSHIPHPTSHSIPPAGGILLLFWLYSAIMIPLSVIPYEAKISTLRVGAYIGIYWATASILSRFPRRKAVLMTVFGFLILIALYSLVQHKVAPNMIFGMERYTSYWTNRMGGRLGGTYQCPNHIAHLFQMWIPFCLMFLFLPQFGWFWRICFGYALPLFAVLIYQTQSRAGLLGLVAGLATTVLLLMLRKSRRAFYIALLVVPLLGAGLLGVLWFGSSMFRERMQPVVKFISRCSSGEEIRDSRPLAWMDTIPMIGGRPLIGFGPGNYGQTFPEYRQRVPNVRIEMVHPHNEYLEMLSEYGLIGAVLIAGVLVCFIIPMIRLIRTSDRLTHALPAVAILAALAGTAVHGFFDFELRIFPNALMLAFLSGAAASPLLRRASGKQEALDSHKKHENPQKFGRGDRGARKGMAR